MIKKYVLTISAALFLSLVLINCSDEKSKENTPERSGEELAKAYCASCHKYAEPSQLDKSSWRKYMLPRMGNMMGIYQTSSTRDSLIEEGPGGELVIAAKIYPEQPVIDTGDWQKIVDFYLANAPEKLPEVPTKNISKNLDQFEVVIPEFKVTPPSSTMAKFSRNNTIYIGDAFSQTLLEFDTDLNLIKRGNVSEGAVWLEEMEDELWLTVMGSFSPTDEPKGMILTIPQTGGKMARVPADQLRRPVHTSYADLNGDGLMDAVVSEFGKWTGRLSLLSNKGNDEFEQSVLIDQSGATRSYIQDFNDDGLLDIIALFGQGNESIYILYNRGDGTFKKDQVLQFSSSNGSSFFDLYDFNDDGHLDIIYTAGDNADFKPVMKHYHGVYIYMNDGNNQFQKSFFYQLNGAYGAIPRDFDQDGDIDIAAISFFPDFENSPEESFVFLENDGAMNFSASTFPEVNKGRWIVMDAKDYDQDGDEDIILGSLAFEVVPENPILKQWVQDGIPFIILKNTSN